MNKKIKSVTVNEACELIKSTPDLTIIDGRNIDMFNNGHIPGAKLIDAFNSNAILLLSALDKEKPYLVYCTTHIRSDMLVKYMEKLGFKEVYVMREGIIGWEKCGLPLNTSINSSIQHS